MCLIYITLFLEYLVEDAVFHLGLLFINQYNLLQQLTCFTVYSYLMQIRWFYRKAASYQQFCMDRNALDAWNSGKNTILS